MDASKIVSLLFEAGTLRKIPRSHQQAFLVSDASDNIAAHSHHVATIGYFLAHSVEGADPSRVAVMCIFHDLIETRTGDQNWIHKKYVKTDERQIRTDQFLPITAEAPGLSALMAEYDERKTIDAIVAKDADYLGQYFLLAEYRHTGNKEAAAWLESWENKRARLKTDAAKELFDEIRSQSPSAWWQTCYKARG